MWTNARRSVIDFSAASLILFASLWTYELSNLLVLSMGGNDASISISFFLPLGTASISNQPSASILLKVLQVVLCAGVGIALTRLAGRASMQMAQLAGLSVVGVYISSFYWEALPGATLSYPLHALAFVGIAGVATGAVLLLAKSWWHHPNVRPSIP